MDITIKINCDNAAFCEDDGQETPAALAAEVGRILIRLGRHVEDGGTSNGKVYDVNGNAVGRVSGFDAEPVTPAV